MKIVVEGQSGESTIGDICIRESISPEIFYQWSKEFLNVNDSLNEYRSI